LGRKTKQLEVSARFPFEGTFQDTKSNCCRLRRILAVLICTIAPAFCLKDRSWQGTHKSRTLNAPPPSFDIIIPPDYAIQLCKRQQQCVRQHENFVFNFLTTQEKQAKWLKQHFGYPNKIHRQRNASNHIKKSGLCCRSQHTRKQNNWVKTLRVEQWDQFKRYFTEIFKNNMKIYCLKRKSMLLNISIDKYGIKHYRKLSENPFPAYNKLWSLSQRPLKTTFLP